jgi:hypothetical protein
VKRLIIFFLLLYGVLCSVTFSQKAFSQSYNTTFRTGDDSWTAGYTGAQSHADDYDIVKIEWKEIDNNKNIYAINFSGKNRNKKLFLYIYKQLSGLKPNSIYNIVFNTQFFANSLNQTGNIYIKAGAISHPPMTFDLPITEANFNKGSIGYDGKDMEVLGVLYPNASSLTGSYEMQNYAKPFLAHTDKDGNLWLIIGVEPQESIKSFDNISLNTVRVLFQYQGEYNPETFAAGKAMLEDNKADTEFNDDIESIEIYTASGHLLKAIYLTDGIFTGNIGVEEFESGRYIFSFNLTNGKQVIRSVEH